MNRVKFKSVALLAVLCLLTVGIGLWLWPAAAGAETGAVRLTRVYTADNTGGGALYATRSGVAVRASGDIRSVSGAYYLGMEFDADAPAQITADDQAVVFDMTVIGGSTAYSLRLGTDIPCVQNSPVYLYNGSQYVKTITTLNSSLALLTLDADGTYDKIVIPMTSFNFTAAGGTGTSYTIESISVQARQGYAMANGIKYILHGAYLIDGYQASQATLDLAASARLYTPADNGSFTPYGQNTTNYDPADYFDARYMEAGELLFDDAYTYTDGNRADSNSRLYLAPEGATDTAPLLSQYDGFYYTVTNPQDTLYHFYWALEDEDGSLYWSSVGSAAKRISPSGEESNVTASYIHENVENVIYYVPFSAFNTLPADTATLFKNRLLFQVTSASSSSVTTNASLSNGPVTIELGELSFVSDGIVRRVSTSGGVTADRAGGMDGMSVTFTAEDTVSNARLNGEALDSDALAALNGAGYTVQLSGEDLQLAAGDYTVSVNTPANGTAAISSDLYSAGESVVLTAKPDTGYSIASVTVNGADRTAEVGKLFKNKLILMEEKNLNIEVSFEMATVYEYEAGTIASLWGIPGGSVFAEYDSVNVQTTKTFASSDPAAYVGITVPVNSSKATGGYLAVRVSSIAANNRYFYVELVNGGTVYRRTQNATYYFARTDGTAGSNKSYDQSYESDEIKGTRIALAARQSLYENATLDVATNLTSNTQGFDGYMIIPLADYGTSTFDAINIYCASYASSYARFNIGEVYSCTLGAEGLPVPGEALWSPSEDYTLYGDTAASAQVQLLSAGDFIMANRGNRGDSTYVYDEMFFTFPENAIGEDGYVDLEATGIKGVEFTVKTEQATRLILRISGADNDGTYQTGEGEYRTTTNLLKNDHSGVSLWQTSGSTHPSVVRLDTGLVKSSSSYIMPHYDSYDGYCTVYIAFTDIPFSNWNGRIDFPTKIHPVMMLLGSGELEDGETSHMNFQSIRFITDDSAFETRTISLTPQNGVINGTIGNESVMASANNRVVPGTAVTFSVTPNRGYELRELWYIDGDDEIDIPLTSLREDGTFEIVVNNDINVYCECRAIVYTIEYNADGGQIDDGNPTTYVVTDNVVLLGATKDGYEFIGWFDEAGNQVAELRNSIGNLVLTARYERSTPVGLIVGLAVGGAVLIAGTVTAVLVVRGKKKCKKQ